MASQRKPSSSKRSASAKKPKAPAKKGTAAKKPAAKKTSSAAPAKKKTVAARKTTTRSAADKKTSTPRRVAAAKPPEPEPGELPERRKLGLPILAAVLLVAIAVAIVLVLTGDDDNNGSTNDASATPTVTTPTAPKPTSPAAGVAPSTAKPAGTVTKCDPILGNGTPYPVTSSAPGTPAPCDEAHTVLIAALNDQAAEVNGWQCVTNLNSTKVAVCTSGDKTVIAHSPA